MTTAIERQTMKKVYLRLLPFCFILYFICYLDRVNIGFAALTMNKDLGLSSYVFGLGAGAFFWGYFQIARHLQYGTGQLFHPTFSPRARRSGLFPLHDPILFRWRRAERASDRVVVGSRSC